MGAFYIISGDDYEEYCEYKRITKEKKEAKIHFENFYNDVVYISNILDRLSCEVSELFNTMNIDNYRSDKYTQMLRKISNDTLDLFTYRNYIDAEIDSRETDDGE